jgi:hypothetical protein
MITASFTLAANTAQLALTGRWVIRTITYVNGAAGTFTAWDNSSTAATQANSAYVDRAVTDPYTRTVTQDDLVGNSETYTYTGVADVAQTVAADPTWPLPVLVSMATPAAGSVSTVTRINTGRGLVLKSTVNATAIVEYEPAL